MLSDPKRRLVKYNVEEEDNKEQEEYVQVHVVDMSDEKVKEIEPNVK